MNARHYTNKLLEMIENGLLDRDNVILACVKYMSEGDVENMMRINEMLEDETPDWDEWDSDEYDVDAMRADYTNGNFDADDADDYLFTAIVERSIENGQFKQAREQCEKYGLNYTDFKS